MPTRARAKHDRAVAGEEVGQGSREAPPAAGRPAGDAEFAYLLRETAVAAKVPADVCRRIEEELAFEPRAGRSAESVWQALRLEERFGVSAEEFLEYVKAYRSVLRLSACGHLVRAIGCLEDVPTREWQKIQEAGLVILLDKIVKAVEQDGLAPEQLAKLADALGKQTAATVKIQALQLQLRKHRATLKRGAPSGRDEPWPKMTLAQAIRRIYGIQLPPGPRDPRASRAAVPAQEPVVDGPPIDAARHDDRGPPTPPAR